MAKVKKTKNDSTAQVVIDGKVDEPKVLKFGQGKRNVRSLDELMGYKSNPYSSLTPDQYEAKVGAMNLSELQAHAASLGVLPVSNKSILAKRLLNEYRKKADGYYNTIQETFIEPKDPAKVAEALRRLNS